MKKNDFINDFLKELKIEVTNNLSIDVEFYSQRIVEKKGTASSSGTINYSAIQHDFGRLLFYPNGGFFSLAQKLHLGDNQYGNLSFDLTVDDLQKFPECVKVALRLAANERQSRTLNYSDFRWS